MASQLPPSKTLPAPPKNRVVLYGDSNMLNQFGASQPSAVSYNTATGVMTITATAHGFYTGQITQYAVQNVAAWCFYDLAATYIDANNYSVVLPVGLGTPPAANQTWISNRFYSSGDYPYAYLHSARPNIVRAVACVSDTAQTIASKIGDVLAVNPAIVDMRLGTNNRNIDPVTTIYGIALGLCKTLSAAGIYVILHTIPPTGETSAVNAAWIVAYNKLLRTIPAQVQGVEICDDWRILIDPVSATGNALSGTLRPDNLHFTAKAGQLIATTASIGLQAAYDRIVQSTPQAPSSLIESYNASNNPSGDDAWGNGMLQTATGGSLGTGITGAVAQSLQTSIVGLGGSAVASVVAATYGNAQRLVGTPAALNDQMQIKTTDLSARVTAGEWRKAVFHMKTSGIPANANLKSICLIVQMTYGGVTVSQVRARYSAQSSASLFPQVDLDDDIESEPFLIPTGLTALTVIAQMNFGAAGSAVTWDVSQWGLQRVLNYGA